MLFLAWGELAAASPEDGLWPADAGVLFWRQIGASCGGGVKGRSGQVLGLPPLGKTAVDAALVAQCFAATGDFEMSARV